MVDISKKNSKRSKISAKFIIFCLFMSTIAIISYIFPLKTVKLENKQLKSSSNFTTVEKHDLSSTSTKNKEVPLLDLPPSTKNIFINIGSHLDPIMPPKSMGPCAHTIAVEPIVGCQIPPDPQLSVIQAAVADEPGVMSMRIYNEGMSSSLANIAKEDFWNKAGRGDNGKLALVPVITLSSLLDSVPPSVNITLLMTDIQGLDFSVVKSGAKSLREKVTHLITEVWLEDVYTYDAQNDLCRDWLPFMDELGYTLLKSDGRGSGDSVRTFCKKWLEDHPIRPTVEDSPGLLEDDAYWVRKDAIHQDFPATEKGRKRFSKEEFATCT